MAQLFVVVVADTLQRIAQNLDAVVKVDAGFAGLAGSSQFWVQRGDKLYAVIDHACASYARACCDGCSILVGLGSAVRSPCSVTQVAIS